MSEVDLGSVYEAAIRIADGWRALVVKRDAEIERLREALAEVNRATRRGHPGSPGTNINMELQIAEVQKIVCTALHTEGK